MPIKKLAHLNLKRINHFVDTQKKMLSSFKEIRTTVHPRSLAAVREANGLMKEITGRKGKRLLDGLKRHRKMAAFALREHRGQHLKLKAKWSSSNLEAFRRISKQFPNRPAGQQAAEAVKNLTDRKINLRGKGVRFVKIRGRIVPIRNKK
jgi:hypothetical protein